MSVPWIKEEEFWVSSFNYDEDVIAGREIATKITIHDTTLRDGEQTSGVVFNSEDKVQIAKWLDEIGVERIEAGSPMVSEDDCRTIERVAKLGLKAEISCLCRGMAADIDKAADCGVNRVIIEIPVGTPRLKYQYAKWSEEEAIEKAVNSLNYAKEKGLKTTLFMMDTARADRGFLDRVLTGVSKNTKLDSITVVDTSGCLLPAATKKIVRHVKSMVPCSVEIHTHNDLGLGLANTLAAVEAGADTIHVCANGLGERTGNVALDEVAMSMYALYGIDLGIQHKKLTELARAVEEKSGVYMANNKPVSGKAIFRRESGLGIDLIENTPLAIFSLVPAAVGQKPQIVLGKKSGAMSIRKTAERLGLEELSEEEVRMALGLVKAKGLEKKGLLTDEEFLSIIAVVKGTLTVAE